MRATSRSFTDLALSLAAPTIWAAHFFALYGAQALICTGPGAAARGDRLLPFAIAATTAAAAGLLGILVLRIAASRRARMATAGIARPAFWREVPSVLALLALLGVLWGAAPTMLLPACASAQVEVTHGKVAARETRGDRAPVGTEPNLLRWRR